MSNCESITSLNSISVTNSSSYDYPSDTSIFEQSNSVSVGESSSYESSTNSSTEKIIHTSIYDSCDINKCSITKDMYKSSLILLHSKEHLLTKSILSPHEINILFQILEKISSSDYRIKTYNPWIYIKYIESDVNEFTFMVDDTMRLSRYLSYQACKSYINYTCEGGRSNNIIKMNFFRIKYCNEPHKCYGDIKLEEPHLFYKYEDRELVDNVEKKLVKYMNNLSPLYPEQFVYIYEDLLKYAQELFDNDIKTNDPVINISLDVPSKKLSYNGSFNVNINHNISLSMYLTYYLCNTKLKTDGYYCVIDQYKYINIRDMKVSHTKTKITNDHYLKYKYWSESHEKIHNIIMNILNNYSKSYQVDFYNEYFNEIKKKIMSMDIPFVSNENINFDNLSQVDSNNDITDDDSTDDQTI